MAKILRYGVGTLPETTYPEKELQDEIKIESAENLSSEMDQIIYLKRLLVTLKQHYEKNLRDLQGELIVEQSKNQQLSSEISSYQVRLEQLEAQHNEELNALWDQQSTLREIVTKTQEELKASRSLLNQPIAEADLIPQDPQLVEELERAKLTILELETALAQEKEDKQNEIEKYKHQLAFLKIKKQSKK